MLQIRRQNCSLLLTGSCQNLIKVLLKDLFTVGPVIVAASVIIFLLRWRIEYSSLGDREAKTLGVSVTVARNFIIISTLLTASAVCISGTIGWIGLVIPHFARMLTGPDNTKGFRQYFNGSYFYGSH